jgi:hypothetical protein
LYDPPSVPSKGENTKHVPLKDENAGIVLLIVALIVPPSLSIQEGIQYVNFSPEFMVLLAGIVAYLGGVLVTFRMKEKEAEPIPSESITVIDICYPLIV